MIEDGKLELSGTVNTGNIVTDSLVGYWERIAGTERDRVPVRAEHPYGDAFKARTSA